MLSPSLNTSAPNPNERHDTVATETLTSKWFSAAYILTLVTCVGSASLFSYFNSRRTNEIIEANYKAVDDRITEVISQTEARQQELLTQLGMSQEEVDLAVETFFAHHKKNDEALVIPPPSNE